MAGLSGPDCTVWADGVRVADGSPGEPAGAPTVLAGLALTWGRTTTVDQPDPASCSFRLVTDPAVDPAGTWLAELNVGRWVQVLASYGTPAACGVFAGRITDSTVGWDSELAAPCVDVICADLVSDLAGMDLGAGAWPAETVAARVARLATYTAPITLTAPATWAGVQLAPVDDVAGLSVADALGTVAASTDCAVIQRSNLPAPATDVDNRAQVAVADPATWPALRELYLDGATVRIRPVPASSADPANVISACLVERDGLTWTRSAADQATRVEVQWWLPVPEDETSEMRTTVVRDPDLEKRIGVLRASTSTELATAAAASTLAERLLQRLSEQAWRVEGLTWDVRSAGAAVLDEGDLVVAGRLLDERQRFGLALILTDLPTWSPVGTQLACYIQGGTYTYGQGADGTGRPRWVLQLNATAPVGGIGASVRWVDLPDVPAWAWERWDPAISWLDLYGTKGPS